MPTNFHSSTVKTVSFGVLLLFMLFTSQAAFAMTPQEDMEAAMQSVISTLRSSKERTEQISDPQLDVFASFSIPESWGMQSFLGRKPQNIRLTRAFTERLAEALQFKPTIGKDLKPIYRVPLDSFFAKGELPLLDRSILSSAKTLRIQRPIVLSNAPNEKSSRGYIQLCSGWKNLYVNTNDLEEKLRKEIFPDYISGTTTDDHYIPNLLDSSLSRTTFLNVSAVRVSLKFVTSLYQDSGETMQYEAIYALKNGYVLCVETSALESYFADYKVVSDEIIRSIVAPEGSTIEFSTFTMWQYLHKNFYLKDKPEFAWLQEWSTTNKRFPKLESKDAQERNEAAKDFVRALHSNLTQVTSEEITSASSELGLHLDSSDGRIEVTDVLKDSIAWRSGLRTHDVIVSVNRKKVTSEDQAMKLMKNVSSSKMLVLFRRGKLRKRAVLTKESSIPSPEITVSLKQDVLHLQMHFFGETTKKLFGQVLQSFPEETPSAILLDLQGSKGGDLDSIRHAIGVFVGPEKLLGYAKTISDKQPLFSIGTPLSFKIPVYILIDENTAYGSQLFAKTMSDLHVATLLGQPTKGLGGLRDSISFADGSVINTLVGEILFADGSPLEGSMIFPDVLLQGVTTDQRVAESIIYIRKSTKSL